MANKINDCAPELKGSFIDADVASEMLKEYSVLDMDEKQALSLKNDVIAATNNKLETVRRKAYDEFIVDTLVSKHLNGNTYKQSLQSLAKDIYGRNSMDTHRRHYRAQLVNKLYDYSAMFGVPPEYQLKRIAADSAEEAKLFKAIENVKFDTDVSVLTPEQARKMVADIDDPIERLAYAVASYNEYTRRFLQNHGVAVERTEGYVTNRRYDSAKIDNPEFGVEDWVADMRTRLDKDATLGKTGATDAELDKYLKNVYEMMKKKTKLKERGILNDSSMPPENRWKARRDFVFKQDDAVDHSYEAFKKYSVGSLGDQIEENAWSISSEAIKVSRLGYNATDNFDKIRGQLVEARYDEKLNAIENVFMNMKEARVRDAAYDIAGANSYVASGMTTLATTAKMAVALKSLGNTLTVAVLDPLDTSRQAFYNTGSFMESMRAFGTYQKNMFQALHENGYINSIKGDFSQLQEVADNLGVVAQFISSDSSMRVARGELSTDSSMIGRAIDAHGNSLMKMATFLPQQTALSKIASASTGALGFTRMLKKRKAGTRLNAYELDTLKEYKLGAADLDILSEIPTEKTWGNGEILSGKSIRDHIMLPPEGVDAVVHREAMAKKLGVAEADLNDAAFAVSSKYDAYLNDFFTRGTPTPELSAKSALGKASGSEGQNVVMGLLSQFMDTPVMQFQSMVELVEKSARINREAHPEAAAFAAHMGADVMKQAVPHLMAGTMMYLAADTMWSAIMNKDSAYDKFMAGDGTTKRSIMLDVFGRTSVVPFAFEALNNATSVYRDGSVLDTVSSPSLQIGSDFLKTMNVNNEQATLERFAKKMIPNSWAIQMIRNRMQ